MRPLALLREQLRRPDGQAVLVLAGLVLLFFAPALSGQRTLLPFDILESALAGRGFAQDVHNDLLSDMVLENLAWKQFLRESLRAGELPFWNPYSLSGTPFLATGQNGALYPLGVLFLALPLPLAYGWFAALHLLLLALGTYLLLRSFGAQPVGGLISAIAGAFGTVMTTTLMWPMVTSTLAWLPWLLLATERGFRGLEEGQGWRALALWGPLAALAIGLMLLAGHLEYSAYALAIWAWFTAGYLVRWLWKRVSLRRWLGAMAGWALVALLGLGLAAPLLLPFARLVPLNYRAGLLTYEQIIGFALPLRHLAALVSPDIFGNPSHHGYFDATTGKFSGVTTSLSADGASQSHPFWGTKNYVEGAGFGGVLTLLLAAGVCWSRRDRATITFLSLGVVSLLLAFGTPLYRTLYLMPGLEQLHTPFRWLYPFLFSVAVLAGLGADALAREGERWRWLARSALALGAALLGFALLSRLGLGATLALVQGLLHRTAALERAFGTPEFLYSYELRNVVVLGGSLLATGMVLEVARGGRHWGPWPRFAPWAALLLAVELVPLGFGFQSWSSPRLPEPTPGVRLLQERSEPLARLVSFGPKEPLTPNLAALYRLPDVRGYDSVILGRYIEFWRTLEAPAGLLANRVQSLLRPESLDSPLLDLLGVRYILSAEPLPTDRFPLLYEGEMRIYENRAALPRAFIVFEAWMAPDSESALAKLREPSFDPRRTVILEGAGATAMERGRSLPWQPVGIVHYSANRVEVEANLPEPGYLVLGDAYAPQWRAQVDGAPAALYRADGAFRAVALSAGPHQAVFTHSAAEFRWGLLLAAASGLLLVSALGGWVWGAVALGPRQASPLVRVLKNTLSPLSAQLVNRAMDLGFAVFMLRLLGPELAGRYAFAVTVVGYMGIVTDFGLNTLLIREVARQPALGRRYLANSVWVRVILWGATLPLLAALLGLYRWGFELTEDTLVAAGLLAFALLPQAGASTMSALFQARERMELPAAVSILTNLVKVGLGVPVLLRGGGIAGLGAVAVVATLVTLLVFWLLIRGAPGIVMGRAERGPLVDPGFQRSLVREAAPLMANNVLSTVFFRADIPLLQALLPAQRALSIGWYSTAYKFLEGLLLIPSLFTLAVFPLLSRYATGRPEAMLQAARRGLKALLLVAFPLSAGLTLVAEQLIRLLFGEAFAPAAGALRILVWFFPFSVINGFLQYVLIAVNQQRTVALAFLIGAGFNIAANLVAIPLFGIQGAAAVTVLSEMVLLAPFLYAVRRSLGTLPLPTLIGRPALATAAMVALLWPLRSWSFLVLAPLGAILYAMAALLLRALDSEDWALLRSLWPRPA